MEEREEKRINSILAEYEKIPDMWRFTIRVYPYRGKIKVVLEKKITVSGVKIPYPQKKEIVIGYRDDLSFIKDTLYKR